jgi:hypothetical protein
MTWTDEISVEKSTDGPIQKLLREWLRASDDGSQRSEAVQRAYEHTVSFLTGFDAKEHAGTTADATSHLYPTSPPALKSLRDTAFEYLAPRVQDGRKRIAGWIDPTGR